LGTRALLYGLYGANARSIFVKINRPLPSNGSLQSIRLTGKLQLQAGGAFASQLPMI
jgi:hypothetical protein